MKTIKFKYFAAAKRTDLSVKELARTLTGGYDVDSSFFPKYGLATPATRAGRVIARNQFLTDCTTSKRDMRRRLSFWKRCGNVDFAGIRVVDGNGNTVNV